ncbi:PREDICTED: facilitated trehalose transporter Tret1-2 homolog [Dinoponera quadriceps]|uniref:Facilitated trehalose transporter Tret1-2 homolog n=1 Tax=Dinoponera quadriceps TaxID=609295 RepID=A0A6P3XUH4_DINQU|nr:PREDICTED: facilitated trehalose transporter Tret1-2 homolog [Dinoponera quadriceps]
MYLLPDGDLQCGIRVLDRSSVSRASPSDVLLKSTGPSDDERVSGSFTRGRRLSNVSLLAEVSSNVTMGRANKLYFRQLLTALAPLLGITVCGMSNGYSAILLPQLKSSAEVNGSDFSPDNQFGSLSIEQESWIAAAAVLPMAPGCWTGGFLAERLGRKTSTLLLFPVFFAGWLIIGLAGNANTLVVGRLLVGYCTGILAPIVPIYVSETSDPVLRGILLGAISLTLSIGILACHALGTWLHWRTTAHICSALPLLCWLIGLFSRESPMWLLNRGELEPARRSWIFFRGEHTLEEFSLMESSRRADISQRQQTEKRSVLRSWRKTWSSRHFLKPLAICCLYFLTGQFSGTNAISFYCVEMLASVPGLTNAAYLITLLIDAIRLAVGVIVCALMKSCRRRAMTFFSGFGVAGSMLALSAVLTFEIGGTWAPVLLLLVYTALLPVGLVPLPWLLCGELFARNFRELGSGVASGFGFLCFFVVIKTMPAMIELIQPQGTFAVYGFVALIGTGVLYFVLPETKNKTLQEIQVLLDGKPRDLARRNADIPILSREKSKNSEKDETAPDK